MFGLTHVVADDVQGLFQRSGSPRRLIEDQCQEEMRQMHEKRQMERGSKKWHQSNGHPSSLDLRRALWRSSQLYLIVVDILKASNQNYQWLKYLEQKALSWASDIFKTVALWAIHIQVQWRVMVDQPAFEHGNTPSHPHFVALKGQLKLFPAWHASLQIPLLPRRVRSKCSARPLERSRMIAAGGGGFHFGGGCGAPRVGADGVGFPLAERGTTWITRQRGRNPKHSGQGVSHQSNRFLRKNRAVNGAPVGQVGRSWPLPTEWLWWAGDVEWHSLKSSSFFQVTSLESLSD